LLTERQIDQLRAAYGSDFYLALVKARADITVAMKDLDVVMQEAYDLIEEGDLA